MFGNRRKNIDEFTGRASPFAVIALNSGRSSVSSLLECNQLASTNGQTWSGTFEILNDHDVSRVMRETVEKIDQEISNISGIVRRQCVFFILDCHDGEAVALLSRRGFTAQHFSDFEKG